jgi:hypothetical protein
LAGSISALPSTITTGFDVVVTPAAASAARPASESTAWNV